MGTQVKGETVQPVIERTTTKNLGRLETFLQLGYPKTHYAELAGPEAHHAGEQHGTSMGQVP